MKITFIIVFASCLACALSLNLRQSTASLTVISPQCSVNLIVNGNFATPNKNGGSGLDNNGTVQGWTSSTGQLEIGLGQLYNPAWNAGQQVSELDVLSNATMTQTVAIAAGGATSCKLSFRYAAKTTFNTSLESSSLSFAVNGATVRSITPADFNVTSVTADVNLAVGSNTISFSGQGTSNAHGVQVTSIVLNCCSDFANAC